MAETASERRMNLTTLQRVDCNITDIIYNASQAALYKFNPKSSEWEKTETEGTFFIYTRTLAPHHGFIVMNRLSTTNLIEPITAGLEFQLQSPFLLYKKATGQIFGIWFYDETECICIEEILNRLCQASSNNQLNVQASQRQRCASEGDKMHKGNSGNKSKGSLDILSLLCQAQEEYDKQQKTSKQVVIKTEPKGIMENPMSLVSNARVQKDIVKPTPLRVMNGSNIPSEENSKKSINNGAPNSESSTKGTSLNLAALFAQASEQQKQGSVHNTSLNNEPYSTSVKSAPIKIPATKPNELQRLFSNPANTVEHIEKQQLNELPTNSNRDRSTSFSGIAGPILTTNDSLEKDIKHQLNLNVPRNDSSFNHSVLNLLPSNDGNIADSLLPHLLNRRHSVSPAMTALTPAALMASNQPLITTEIEGPIITPAMFQQSHELSPLSSPFLKSPHSVGNDFPFGPLLCPINFTQPLAASKHNQRQELAISNAPDNNSRSKETIALTKDHLRESLVYLLQNDGDFLTKVHEGYIASLKSQLGKFRMKSSNS